MGSLSHRRFLTRLLAICLLVGLLGSLQPVLVNEGGSLVRMVAKQSQLGMVEEEKVEDYFEAILYGEGEVAVPGDTAAPEAERRQVVERLYQFDRWIAVGMGAAALLLLIPGLRERSRFRHILPVLSLWWMAEAIGATVNGGKTHAELTFLAHATRWGLPLVLWGMVWNPGKNSCTVARSSWLVRLAVICTSLTFAVHGWEALRQHPSFQDLVHGFAGLVGGEVSPSTVRVLLGVIGMMDLLLAAGILRYRHPGLFFWMACWGLITALSRPLTLGVEAWPELAMRTANFALPLVLFLIHFAPGVPLADTKSEPSHA